jgi:FkbM family methyltransferase
MSRDIQKLIDQSLFGSNAGEKSQQRDSQLSSETYNPLISYLVGNYYRAPNHPFKLRFLRNLEKILGQSRIITSTNTDFKMAIDQADLIQRHVFYDGVWEPELTTFLVGEFRHDDIFLDIGANVGYFTCLAASRNIKQTIAFEPDPLNCEVLNLNLLLNRFKPGAVKVIQKALGSTVGTLKFHRANVANTGISGFTTCNTVASFDVEVDTLDHLFATGEIPQATIIKMDVEGWEEEVLRGALDFLKKAPPRIIIFEAVCIKTGEIKNQHLTQILETLGFSVTESLMDQHGPNHIARYISSQS